MPEPRFGYPVPVALAALRDELLPLFRRLRRRHRVDLGSARGYKGLLGGEPLLAVWTGDGPRAARRGVEALLARYSIERLLIVGLAGGLSTSLRPSELIVAERVLDVRGTVPSPDGAALARLVRRRGQRGLRVGTLYSAERIVGSAVEKARLWNQIELPEPAAVDLETATYARAAAAHRLPYLAVRAISDGADESLPVDFNRWLDGEGRVRRSRVALWAATHPQAIRPLLRLARRLSTGAQLLADVIEEWFIDGKTQDPGSISPVPDRPSGDSGQLASGRC